MENAFSAWYNTSYHFVRKITANGKAGIPMKKGSSKILKFLAVIGVLAVCAAIGYAVYKFLNPDYLEDFEDDFDDDFDDYFEDEEDASDKVASVKEAAEKAKEKAEDAIEEAKEQAADAVDDVKKAAEDAGEAAAEE